MKKNLPQIVAPPYHTKLGRSEVGRAVQQVYKDEAQRERDRLVMEYLPLAKEVALKVHESLPIHVDLDDIVHAAVLGLFDAATKYSPEKKVAFVSYAKHRIKGAILDSLRQLDWASRNLRRQQKHINAAMAELGPDATESQIAERMGVSLEHWRQMIAGLEGAELKLPAGLPGKGKELPSVVERAMAQLTPRDRDVVTLYYSTGKTMREIADQLGIDESRASELRKSALTRLASALTAQLG